MTKRKNILFIVSRLPINTQTGDRLRVYHFIKKLTERGHHIDVIGFVPNQKYSVRTDIEEICRQCIGIRKEGLEFKKPNRIKQLKLFFNSFFGKYPYRVWQWYDRNFLDQLHSLLNHKQYDVIHVSEVVMGIALKNLRDRDDETPIIFDLIDSVALSLKNVLRQEISILWPFRFIEYKRLKRYEKHIVETVNKAILISERDKNFLKLKDIAIIPNGIEENSLQERTRDIDLLFTGNMAAEANIDAARWFAEDIMPKLLRRNTQVHFTIAGAHPPDSIKALQSSNITVTGFVQDMNAYYRRAKLFVCPMRLGAGQKNKILEAMINHAPVISTAEGNIGIDGSAEAICIADDAEAFVDLVINLLKDEARRNKLAQNGYKYAKKNFSWEKSTDLLEQCYEV